jgi:cytochrome c-type biogenesis protein CcmE
MNKAALVGILAAGIGLCAMVYAFMTNASPYVTIAQARTTAGDSLHLPGDILPRTLVARPLDRRVEFRIRDEKGDEVRVVYKGQAPANMGEATSTVAIGKMNGDVFEAKELLLKCPSKYEGSTQTGGRA